MDFRKAVGGQGGQGWLWGSSVFLLFMCVCLSESFLPSLLAFPYSSYLYGTSNKDTHFRPGASPHFVATPSPLLVLECQSTRPCLSEVYGVMGMEHVAVGEWVVDSGFREMGTAEKKGDGGWVGSVG